MNNETKHTPEPWEVRKHNYGNVRDAEGIFMVGNNAAIVDSVYGRNIHEADANARRIVACVNACAGISTEILERGAPIPAKHFQKERDELAAALQDIERKYDAQTDAVIAMNDLRIVAAAQRDELAAALRKLTEAVDSFSVELLTEKSIMITESLAIASNEAVEALAKVQS